MPVVSVSMPADLIDRLDAFAADHDYTGRSEVVREGARALLTEFDNERLEERPLAAVVSALYDFGSRPAERRITRLRHEYEAEIASNVHSHVDEYCMELFVLETDLETVSTFVGQVRSTEDVQSVEYSLLALDTVGQLPERYG
ncbi:CopG family ribbon-helix-helix protein [Natronobiforma cellulositropha]|uniref:CopG family ribbon-helix-helix protein n=1 Tax=Natronobiforma cellulositropha TaxID=1679076 RepID=UPI0021D57139|nr:CopG family ribbon-helix-helix protein [Natronobiforma cellulositropha]